MATPVDRSKVGRRSRQKGAGFERRISKKFSEWLGCKVRRTPMSGAYGSDWHLGGDLMFDIDVPWYVELKNRENWRLEQFFSHDPCGPVLEWLQSTWDEAEKADKVPMVIFTRNRVDSYVALPLFHLERDLLVRDACRINSVMFIPGMWVIAPLDSFMEVVSPETVRGWRTAQEMLWEVD